MTSWSETSDQSTSWTERAVNSVKADSDFQGADPTDEWDQLWNAAHDFTPWVETPITESTWTES